MPIAYNGVRTRVKTLVGDTDDFPIDIELYQGSGLSSFLFTIVMDELIKRIQDKVPWCMLFADDIVLIDENRQAVDNKLKQWRATLEAKSFRLSRSNTEYLRCRFSAGEEGVVDEVTTEGKVISRVERFRYVASIIKRNGKIDDDINQQIKLGWKK